MAGVWELWAYENNGAFENCGRENGRRVKFKKILKLKNLINDNNNAMNYFKNVLL
jgi:hypothetical protein